MPFPVTVKCLCDPREMFFVEFSLVVAAFGNRVLPGGRCMGLQRKIPNCSKNKIEPHYRGIATIYARTHVRTLKILTNIYLSFCL